MSPAAPARGGLGRAVRAHAGGLGRRSGRSRGRWVAALVVAGVGFGPAIASAVPPGGVAENPRGAVAVVAPSEVVVGGVATFTGTGFSPGEEVTAKVDDGAILRKGSQSDVLASLVAAGDGTIAGSIDLSAVNDATPVAPGPHLIRLLSSAPAARSLRADFTVVAPTPAPGTPTPTPPSTAPGTGAPGNPGTSTPAPGTPSNQLPGTTPVVARGVVWLRASMVRVRSSRVTLKLQAGAAGSAGKVTVRSALRLRVGKQAAKRHVLFRTESYFVDRAGKSTVRLTLTAAGKKLVRPGKALEASVLLKDVTGESVVETVTVQR